MLSKLTNVVVGVGEAVILVALAVSRPCMVTPYPFTAFISALAVSSDMADPMILFPFSFSFYICFTIVVLSLIIFCVALICASTLPVSIVIAYAWSRRQVSASVLMVRKSITSVRIRVASVVISAHSSDICFFHTTIAALSVVPDFACFSILPARLEMSVLSIVT